jgi:hypothetical protein
MWLTGQLLDSLVWAHLSDHLFTNPRPSLLHRTAPRRFLGLTAPDKPPPASPIGHSSCAPLCACLLAPTALSHVLTTCRLPLGRGRRSVGCCRRGITALLPGQCANRQAPTQTRATFEAPSTLAPPLMPPSTVPHTRIGRHGGVHATPRAPVILTRPRPPRGLCLLNPMPFVHATPPVESSL